MAGLGPALLELADRAHADLPSMGIIFSMRSGGFVIGSALTARLIGSHNAGKVHRILTCMMFLMGLSNVAVPYMKSLYTIGTIVVVQGVACGFMDSCVNVLLMWMFRRLGEKAEPYMQTLHFMFALGAFISPLMIGELAHRHGGRIELPFAIIAASCVPFSLILLCYDSPHPIEENAIEENDARKGRKTSNSNSSDAVSQLELTSLVASSRSNGGEAEAGGSGGDDNDDNDDDDDSSTNPRFDPAREILSGGHQNNGYARVGRSDPLDSVGSNGVSGVNFERRVSYNRNFNAPLESDQCCIPCCTSCRAMLPQCEADPIKRRTVTWTALFLGLYVGAEVATGGLLFSYTVKKGLADEPSASILNAAFWGALALGRLFAIPTSMCMSSINMIKLNFAGCSLALGLVLFSADSINVLWVSTIIYGVSMASMYPTAMLIAESIMGSLSSNAGSILVMGASAGEMAIPFIISLLFRFLPLRSLYWSLAVVNVAAIAVFVLLIRMKRDHMELQHALNQPATFTIVDECDFDGNDLDDDDDTDDDDDDDDDDELLLFGGAEVTVIAGGSTP
jgi:fucose permease